MARLLRLFLATGPYMVVPISNCCGLTSVGAPDQKPKGDLEQDILDRFNKLTPEQKQNVKSKIDGMGRLRNKNHEEQVVSLSPKASQELSPPGGYDYGETPQRCTLQVKFLVNDTDWGLTSDGQSFDTPPLQPGRTYFYIMEVKWKSDGREITVKREVDVAAGALESLTLASRPP